MRNNRRLTVSRETIRQLTGGELGRAGGGIETTGGNGTIPRTMEFNCVTRAISCNGPCTWACDEGTTSCTTTFDLG